MSTGKRRVFDREFKLSAIEQLHGGASAAALCQELQISRGFRNGVVIIVGMGPQVFGKPGDPARRMRSWIEWPRPPILKRLVSALASWNARSGSRRSKSIFFD